MKRRGRGNRQRTKSRCSARRLRSRKEPRPDRKVTVGFREGYIIFLLEFSLSSMALVSVAALEFGTNHYFLRYVVIRIIYTWQSLIV